MLRSIISILIFITGTTLSYRNDMPKDGYETMGFPLSFYRNNPDPVDMAAKADNLYPWYLVFDFLCHWISYWVGENIPPYSQKGIKY